MAKTRKHKPVLCFAAIFSKHIDAINGACDTASRHWGKIVIQSDDFPFDATRYYEPTMGSPLRKRLVAFEPLINAEELVSRKILANQWEAQMAKSGDYEVSRPINIDPGYVSEAKVVLATMKDRDHRLYLGEGVFGEVTLYYQLPGQWVDSRWTYADYKKKSYHAFFHDCRKCLRDRLQASIAQR